MDVEAARMLVRGLKIHKRKGAAASGSTKKARMEETSSATPAQVALTIDVPSDVEPPVPRASSRSSPVEVPAHRNAIHHSLYTLAFGNVSAVRGPEVISSYFLCIASILG